MEGLELTSLQTVGNNPEGYSALWHLSNSQDTLERTSVVPTYPLHGLTLSPDLSIRLPHPSTPEDKAVHFQHRAIY